MKTHSPAQEPAQQHTSTAAQVVPQPAWAESVMEEPCPTSLALQRLQNIASASPRAMQLTSLQAMTNTGGRAQFLHTMQAMAQAPVQREARPNNTGLPDGLKSGIESLSGMSMDHVRVHYNSDRPPQLQAHAYAQGSEIHVAPGQEKHLPHEAWHVVQQAQGRVRPTVQVTGGVEVNDDVGLEAEADLMGAHAARFIMNGTTNTLVPMKNDAPVQRESHQAVQRAWKTDELGQLHWEGEWDTARLMCKEPEATYDVEAYAPPKLLFWNRESRRYEASVSSFRMEYEKTHTLKANERVYNTLLFWKELAAMLQLKESNHILTQIVDTIDNADEDNSEPVLLAYGNTSLLGISIYSFDTTTEGAPDIPESAEHWLYVSYSAADPLSQQPRNLRGPTFGGTGAAMNKHYDFLAAAYQRPVYRHAENPISYLSLLRAGYQDVYAEEDRFKLPAL